MSDSKKIMDMIKENDISFVDLRFTDPRGKMQHVTQHIDTIDEEFEIPLAINHYGNSLVGFQFIQMTTNIILYLLSILEEGT